MPKSQSKKLVEVCFTPSSYELYKNDFDVVVVIDVLRATTAICTAFEHGIEKVIPVSTIEEALAYKSKGFLVGAERNGQIVEGFDIGNSPLSYMSDDIQGKTLVLTTTNGTKAINIAADRPSVVIGSLVNLDVLCDWLINNPQNTLILGSGWKNKFNLEDTVCAGAIADKLIESRKFFAEEDSTIAAKYIYRSAKENIFGYLKASSHRRRLRNLNLNEDVKFCLNPNTVNVIPILKNGELVKLEYAYEAVRSI